MKVVRSNWQGAVLVCGKCSRKVGGGFGENGKTSLAKALRKHLGTKKGRKGSLGVIETSCLDVCPKKAVVVVNTAHSGVWSVIAEKTPVADVARALGVARGN
ncbi:MAG: (2Fe-2S) ferredoxin domain-containing protein [Pacificimonas sp.]